MIGTAVLLAGKDEEDDDDDKDDDDGEDTKDDDDRWTMDDSVALTVIGATVLFCVPDTREGKDGVPTEGYICWMGVQFGSVVFQTRDKGESTLFVSKDWSSVILIGPFCCWVKGSA